MFVTNRKPTAVHESHFTVNDTNQDMAAVLYSAKSVCTKKNLPWKGTHVIGKAVRIYNVRLGHRASVVGVVVIKVR